MEPRAPVLPVAVPTGRSGRGYAGGAAAPCRLRRQRSVLLRQWSRMGWAVVRVAPHSADTTSGPADAGLPGHHRDAAARDLDRDRARARSQSKGTHRTPDLDVDGGPGTGDAGTGLQDP